MQQSNNLAGADIGDFEKMMAVFAVIIQSVISFVMNSNPPIGQRFFFGGIYETVKFSAPAFIFGILYSTTRTHPQASILEYPQFIHNRWHILFVPTIWWTFIYLLFLPQLQQHYHYHNWQGFCWQFINGNAAPHLWYNTMMLQFIILMPLFWWLARLVAHHPYRAISIFCGTLLLEDVWFYSYDLQIFHDPLKEQFYFFDRLFVSFLIYAIAGTLLWKFRSHLAPFLMRHWLMQVILWLILFYIVTINFFSYGLPVKLTNAPYYLPSMIFYNLATISLIATLLLNFQKKHNQWLPLIHWVALYAYRAYLSHVFWLYWCWQLLNHLRLHLSLAIIFPSLVFLTIILSFLSAYGLHLLWTIIKNQINLLIVVLRICFL